MRNVANKKVTIIEGMEAYGVDLALVAKYLQRKCSGAGSTSDGGGGVDVNRGENPRSDSREDSDGGPGGATKDPSEASGS